MSRRIVYGNNIQGIFTEGKELPILVALNPNDTKTVENITTEGNLINLMAKGNGGYFYNQSGSRYGEPQGAFGGFLPDNTKIFGLPNQEKGDGGLYQSLIVYDDNTYEHGAYGWDGHNNDKWWNEDAKDRMVLVLSIARILIENGEDVNIPSTALKVDADSISRVYFYRFLVRFTNGEWGQFITKNNSPRDIRAWLRTERSDVEAMYQVDSGGSCKQGYWDGSKVVYTDYDGENRKVPNIVAFATSDLFKYEGLKPKEWDYTNANDFIDWALIEKSRPNYYNLDKGIGYIDNDGRRRFDCTGLFKCFLWHDYSQFNPSYYRASQDNKAITWLNAVKNKGVKGVDWDDTLSTLPDMKGVAVWQNGSPYEHIGYTVNKELIIESTPIWDNGIQFSTYTMELSNKLNVNLRDSWSHWFKLPQLTYGVDPEPPVEPVPPVEPEDEVAKLQAEIKSLECELAVVNKELLECQNENRGLLAKQVELEYAIKDTEMAYYALKKNMQSVIDNSKE